MQKVYSYETEYAVEFDRNTVVPIRIEYTVNPDSNPEMKPPELSQPEEPPEVDVTGIYIKKQKHWLSVDGDLYEEILNFVGETAEEDMLRHAAETIRKP